MALIALDLLSFFARDTQSLYGGIRIGKIEKFSMFSLSQSVFVP